MPTKIAILIPRLHGGGAEFVATQWAAYLTDHDCDVTVVTTHQSAATGAETTPYRVERLTSGSFPSRVTAFRSLIERERFDTIISLMPHWNILALLAVATLRQKPRVMISGRNIESGLRTTLSASYRRELFLAKHLYRRADGYIAISHPVAAEAIAGYGLDPDRVFVVPNPAAGKLDLDKSRALRESRGMLDRSKRLTLAVPARIVDQKRPEVVLLVADELRRRGIAVAVEYFGDGPLRDAISKRAEELGIPLVLHGWVETWYDSAADDAVVLLPSVSEGFGNVFVEAAAVGIPSVASSKALGLADAIVPGITGMLCIGQSVSDLADGVQLAAAVPVPVELTDWLHHFSPEYSGAALVAALGSVR
ncbi:hypothetical protein B7R22_02865 [Subtercola boreus]|uniref:D-inositol 3-phosphate glycosyltransferase n=1 Tax=Subtercola boreus TaxID=120213 RepID=A0A3E0W250_9MICO|nr:glycosyltransferase [Subtercola boreus]RFA16444.1 hypothetical protein B7R22_02865 [Subtercola boreus]